jgi:mono/diheme cytochrome c family protein
MKCAPARLLGALTVCAGLPFFASFAHAAQGQPTSKVAVTDYDMQKAASPTSLSESELRGKKLFVQRCSLCHDLLGQPAATTVGPWVDGEVVKARGEAAVREKIRTGSRRMPGFQYTFEGADIDRIISYLKTVTPDQKPKPPRQFEVPID